MPSEGLEGRRHQVESGVGYGGDTGACRLRSSRTPLLLDGVSTGDGEMKVNGLCACNGPPGGTRMGLCVAMHLEEWRASGSHKPPLSNEMEGIGMECSNRRQI